VFTENIFSLVHILLFIDMFYELYKIKKPLKKENKAEKNVAV
jgi:hypothetical protein